MAPTVLKWIFLLLLLVLEFAVVLGLVIMFSSGLISHFYGAPYVPIKRKLVKDLLAFGGLGKDDVFFDLGSGDGRVLITAVKDFNVPKAVGYEIALWPYLKARFLLRRAHLSDRIKIFRKNFFKADLSDATFIYLYLFPKLVDRLAGKMGEEARPGTKILSVSFPINLDVHRQFRLLKAQNFGKITAYLYTLTPT